MANLKGLNHSRRALLPTTLVALVSACGIPDVARVQAQATPTPNPHLSDDAAPARPRVSPETAQVSLTTDPFLAPATEGSSLEVPTLLLSGIEEEKADYVQVARCQVGTELKTSTGTALDAIPAESALRLEQLQWIWINKVWSNTQKCRIVGGASARIARDRFQDLSAPNGEFFYVVNPCILPDHSDKKEVCSYNLVVTEPLAYTNTLEGSFRETAERLAQAEGVLAGLYSQLYYAAHAIRSQQEACENNHAVSEANRNFWRGLTSLTLGGVGAVVGGLVSGGTASLQGFKTGLGLAIGFFQKQPQKPLICPLVDPLVEQSQQASGKLKSAMENVLALREKLAEIDSTYAALDRKAE